MKTLTGTTADFRSLVRTKTGSTLIRFWRNLDDAIAHCGDYGDVVYKWTIYLGTTPIREFESEKAISDREERERIQAVYEGRYSREVAG